MLRRRTTPGRVEVEGYDHLVEIGRGGFASVYRAVEAGTGRVVALKVLDVADVLPHVLEMFERETVALGALSSHPNIVTLYRSTRSRNGRPVLVLEHCEVSMTDRLRATGPMVAREATELAVKLCGALETAHRGGVLHRDIKPQNVLVTDYGEPALADFGLAQLQASGASASAAIGFTTLHAAPELLEGGEVGASTDVYELASTVYQLLVGRAAFSAFDGEAPAAVILRILRDPVTPIVADGVPTALSDLVLRAMSKDPATRPQSALDFAHGLQHIQHLRGWPVTPCAVAGAGNLVAPDLDAAATPARTAAPTPPTPPGPGAATTSGRAPAPVPTAGRDGPPATASASPASPVWYAAPATPAPTRAPGIVAPVPAAPRRVVDPRAAAPTPHPGSNPGPAPRPPANPAATDGAALEVPPPLPPGIRTQAPEPPTIEPPAPEAADPHHAAPEAAIPTAPGPTASADPRAVPPQTAAGSPVSSPAPHPPEPAPAATNPYAPYAPTAPIDRPGAPWPGRAAPERPDLERTVLPPHVTDRAAVTTGASTQPEASGHASRAWLWALLVGALLVVVGVVAAFLLL